MTGIPGSILAVMAHPDDAELWMGGTLALHAKTSHVVVLVATQDALRKAEAEKSAKVLGVEVVVVGEHSREIFTQLVGDLRPDIVVTHRFDDFHVDHRRTADIVLAGLPETVIATEKPSRLYVCDTYDSLTLSGTVQARTIVDVTETFPVKLEALALHKSQPLAHFLRMAERLGATWGGRIGKAWGEAFDPVPILGRYPGASHL